MMMSDNHEGLKQQNMVGSPFEMDSVGISAGHSRWRSHVICPGVSVQVDVLYGNTCIGCMIHNIYIWYIYIYDIYIYHIYIHSGYMNYYDVAQTIASPFFSFLFLWNFFFGGGAGRSVNSHGDSMRRSLILLLMRCAIVRLQCSESNDLLKHYNLPIYI